jgi:4-oxalomesaconate tautomerase
MILRGGTSKGSDFLADDLPHDPERRDVLLLSIMGSPDPRQIKGVAGAHPLTSKIAIVSRSKRPDCDVDIRFRQVAVDKPRVDVTPNCGNIRAGVALFAVERGLMKAESPVTRVRVHTVNTGTIAELKVQTCDGHVVYGGETRFDGAPGTAAPIAVEFLDLAGSVCGSLLLTGNAVDRVAGVDVTMIGNGMPVVVLEAASVGRTGYEPHDVLDKDTELKTRLEEMRLEAGGFMSLGDVLSKVVPKMALVPPPAAGEHVCACSFIPHECHASIGVFAAVTVATAYVLPGSSGARVAQIPPGRERTLSVEHPTGEFSVVIAVCGTEDSPVVEKAGLSRMAYLLFEGYAYVHEALALRPEADRDAT